MEDETKLLEQLKQGEQKAFDKLFRMYYKYLVTIAYGYTKDSNLSKDLVQEVFFDLWKRRAKHNIKVSIRAFLKRAVINQALSSNKRRKPTVSAFEGGIALGEAPEAHRNVEYNELNKKIQSIIDQMPEKCRAIFKLSRFENLSHKEIAQQLNISTKTIENQITKALKMLRAGLKEDYFIAVTIFLTVSI